MKRSILNAGVALVAVAAFSPAAHAQNAATASPNNASASTGEIIVTGSRIPQPNLTSASPVTVVGAADVKLQGVTRAEDLINALPQVFASQGSNISNGATGTANIDLRGLGPQRTLVLINGKRLMPGDVGGSAADVNFIPTSLIKRVDVLTGGSGSVYGSDAVAGVVNFIMDTDFTGFRADAQYSLYQHHNNAAQDVIAALTKRNFSYPTGDSANGAEFQGSLTFGAKLGDGRGHVTAYATYDKSDAVLQSSRDYSSCVLGGAPGAFSCGGSSTSPTGRFFPNTAGSYTVQGNNFVPWNSSLYAYNYGPLNYYHRPDERYTFGTFADYEISPAFHPYLEAMFMNDRSVAQIAPSGDFGNTLTVPCDNPLLSAQEVSLICTPANSAGTVTRPSGAVVELAGLQILRRNVEGGPRQDDQEHTDFRIVAGMKGDFSPVFSYDTYIQYGKVAYSETYYNDLSIVRLGRALDVTTNPANGQPVCASVLNGTDPACVPYNVFQQGGVTPAATAYLGVPGLKRGDQQQFVYNGSITADLGKAGIQSPLARTGVAFNVGYEFRRDSGFLQPDLEFTSGDLSGQGGPTTAVAGSTTASEFFGELRVPLISDRPFFETLSVDGSYRHSNFSNTANSTSADSYKVEGIWKPVRDVMFRASYNRAVRAANIGELYSPQSVNLDGATDPCAGTVAANGTVNGFTAAQCARTGVTAAQFGNITPNSASQYNGLLGGNPGLAPEIGKTFTAGVVVSPRMVPGLSVSVDYFDIKIKNLVGTIGADLILQQCLNNNLYCNLIHRDQFGSLWRTSNGFVTDTLLNAGDEFSRGLDVNFNYKHHYGFGSIGAELVGTYLIKNGFTPVGGTAIDCVGQFGPPNCGVPAPEWRHKARLIYTSDSGFSLSGAWRFYGPVTSSSGDGYRVPPQSYFDLTATFHVADKFSWRVGVNNLTDKSPPLIGTGDLSGVTGNGNTYPQVYDALGRYIFTGITLDL